MSLRLQSPMIVHEQSPRVITLTPALRKLHAPRNGVMVQHQLEFLHLVEHLELREPLQLPGLDVPPSNLAQRDRLRRREAQIEESARERGEIMMWLCARERHVARLPAVMRDDPKSEISQSL